MYHPRISTRQLVSLIMTRNNQGPSFVPWGTPDGTERRSEWQSWASCCLYLYIILHGKMSSSDDSDTNTSDKCVSGERNRERERDSGVVCVLVMWNRIGPSPLRRRPLFWLNQTNKTSYYTSSCCFKGKIWQSDNSWYKVSKIFNGISSGPACLQFAFHY